MAGMLLVMASCLAGAGPKQHDEQTRGEIDESRTACALR